MLMNIVRRWLFNRSRFIFTYWNGTQNVKGDPMVIWRALQQHEDFREEDFKLITVDALRNKIIAKIAGVVREVFSIKLPEAGGLTELECLDVLRSYMAYSGFQKKNTEGTPTLPMPTDLNVSAPSIQQQNTSEDSECTSTSTEQEHGSLNQSPKA